jgi:uncharacterized protein (TIGR03067 family)
MFTRTLLIASVGLFVVAVTRADDKDADELKKLAGTWIAVMQEKDGAELPTKDVDNPQLTIKPDGKYQYQSGDQSQQGTVKCDSSSKPGKMDLVPDDSKQKPIQCIYQQNDKGQLQVCMGAPGKDRPKQFSTQKGTGQTCITYKKKSDK